MCGLESVCAFLWAVSQERLIEEVGANISSLSTQRGPLFPLVQPSLWGSVPLSSPVPLHLTGPPLQAWSSAALQRWADEETRDPTFARSTERWCFHLDLYHSCSCASPMNICLIHCFFFIFPQEGAFALVFKSIHFPGEAIATRSARAMVSLNCNTLRFPHSFLALSIFWDELLLIISLRASEQEPEGYNLLSPEKIYDVHLQFAHLKTRN